MDTTQSLAAVLVALVAAEHLAREGHRRVASELLNSIVRARPAGHITTAAQDQAARMRTGR